MQAGLVFRLDDLAELEADRRLALIHDEDRAQSRQHEQGKHNCQ